MNLGGFLFLDPLGVLLFPSLLGPDPWEVLGPGLLNLDF